MEDERERLFNEFNHLALRVRDLGAVVQNEIPEEYIDFTIDDFKRYKLSFNMSLDILTNEVVEYLESLKR